MKYLLFGSLFFCLFISCVHLQHIVTEDKTFRQPFWTPELRDTAQKNNYRILFATSKVNITGICILKQINGAWRGSIINEFGLKVFDFVSTPEKCELLNVISFLDKWYIKKVIASDIQFIMEIDHPNYKMGAQARSTWHQDTLSVNFKNKKELQRISNQTIVYTNKKRAITYTLQPLFFKGSLSSQQFTFYPFFPYSIIQKK